MAAAAAFFGAFFPPLFSPFPASPLSPLPPPPSPPPSPSSLLIPRREGGKETEVEEEEERGGWKRRKGKGERGPLPSLLLLGEVLLPHHGGTARTHRSREP